MNQIIRELFDARIGKSDTIASKKLD